MSSLSRWLFRRPVTRPRTPAPTPTRTILGRDLRMEDRINPTPDLSVNSFVSTTQEGGSPADYGLFLNGAEPNQTITVHYSFGGTATHTDDYTASLNGGGTLPQTGTINMTADEWGSANAGISIDAIADGIPEPSENVILTIVEDPAYIINAGSESTAVTIEGTIAEVSYYPSGTESMPEGDPGSYFLLYRTDTTGSLTVNLSYAGTATFGSDYTAPTTATFQDGLDTSDPIGITTIEDSTPEGDESIDLTVEPGTGYTVGSPATGTGMILEDDAAPPTPTVEVYNSLDAAEGGSDGDFAIFVTGAEPFADVTVSFTLTGTATDPDDYTPSKTVSVTVTTDEFGDASTDVFITARPDNLVDPDETVVLTISDDPGYTITASSATMTIIDDPARVAIGPDTQDVDEGWQGGLTLSRTGGDLNQPLTVLFSLGSNGYGDQMADSIDDFALTEPSLSDLDNGLFEVTFPAGFTAVYVGVPAVDDNMQEETEGFRATVVAPDGWPYLPGDETDGSKWADVRIIDAPAPIVEGEVAVSISESQVIEGGTAQVTFRRQGTVGTLLVYFDLSGSATLGEDYNAIGETDATGRFVEIADGASSVTVTLTTLDDTLLEGTEHLFVSVLPGAGYNPADAEGAVLPILDNEMGTIGGIAWLDDGDGIRQDTEGAAAGAPVALLDGGSEAFRQTTTGTDGAYQFDDVPAGTYSVWFGQAVTGKREYTLAKQGTDITRDSDVDQSNGNSDMITLSVDTTEDLSVGAGFLVLDLSPPPPPDTPPTISSVDDRQIVPGGTTGEIAFTVGDAETPADDLVVTATLLNLPNDSTGPVQVVTGGTGSNRTVTVTGAPGWSGLAAVQLGVTDAGGALMTTAFNVVIQQANNPPTFVDGNGQATNKYTATVGIHAPKGALVINTPATDPDPGDVLKYSITSVQTTSGSSLPLDSFTMNGGALLINNDSFIEGLQLIIGIKVVDSGGLSATATVTATYAQLVAVSAVRSIAVEGNLLIFELRRAAELNSLNNPLTISYEVDWGGAGGPAWQAASYADFDNPGPFFPSPPATNGTITFAAGKSTVQLWLEAKADGNLERAEKFRIWVLDGQGYATVHGGGVSVNIPVTTVLPPPQQGIPATVYTVPDTGMDMREGDDGFIFDGLTLFADRDYSGQPSGDPSLAYYNDIAQQSAPNCYMLASAAAIVVHPTEAAKFMTLFRDNGDGTYSVTFKTGVPNKAVTEKVSIDLVKDARDYLLLKPDVPKDFDSSGKLEIWPIVLEKAYQQFLKGMGWEWQSRLAGGGDPHWPMTYFGWPSSVTTLFPSAEPNLQNIVTSAFQEKRAVVFGTWPSTSGKKGDIVLSDGTTTLMRSHVYAVVGIEPNNGGIRVFNPWNGGPNGGVLVVPWADIDKAFGSYTYVKP